MTSKTMYLPGFSGLMRRSRATDAAKEVMEQVAEVDGLAKLVANFVPFELFSIKDGGRSRMFTADAHFYGVSGPSDEPAIAVAGRRFELCRRGICPRARSGPMTAPAPIVRREPAWSSPRSGAPFARSAIGLSPAPVRRTFGRGVR